MPWQFASITNHGEINPPGRGASSIKVHAEEVARELGRLEKEVLNEERVRFHNRSP